MDSARSASNIYRPPSTFRGFDRLPNELLLLVLLDLASRVHEARAHTSFVLASVCQRWRRLLLDTPLFWSNLCISVHRDGPRNRGLTDIVPYVDVILERSRNRVPLHIRFDVPYEIDADNLKTLTLLLPRFMPRVGELEIAQSQSTTQYTPRSVSMLNSSVLKFLLLPTPELWRVTIHHDEVMDPTGCLLPHAPKLREIVLNGFCLDHLSPNVLAALRFVALHNDDIPPPTIRSLNYDAPLLEFLDLSCRQSDEFDFELVSLLKPFKHLRTLHMFSTYQLSMFASDVFPALTHLDIRLHFEDDVATQHPDRLPTAPFLRTLSIDCSDYYEESSFKWGEVMGLLLHFPLVQQLKLVCPGDTAEFWTRFIAPDATAAPLLTNLIVANDSFNSDNEVDKLLLFLQARQLRVQAEVSAAPSPLAVLELRHTSFPPDKKSLLLPYVNHVVVD